MKKQKEKHCSGFTLVELIVVITVGGIVAAAVGLSARRADEDSKTGRGLHRLLSDVRYAQETAVAQNTDVNFSVSTGDNSYDAVYGAGGFLKSPMNQADMVVYFNRGEYNGVRITATGLGAALTFNRTGEPLVGGAAIQTTVSIATINGARSVVINPAGYTFIQ